MIPEASVILFQVSLRRFDEGSHRPSPGLASFSGGVLLGYHIDLCVSEPGDAGRAAVIPI